MMCPPLYDHVTLLASLLLGAIQGVSYYLYTPIWHRAWLLEESSVFHSICLANLKGLMHSRFL